MFALKDLTTLLEKWNVWKELKANADKVPDLEHRISCIEKALEQRPTKAAGEQCRFCGESELRLTDSKPIDGSMGNLGVMKETWTCGACQKSETKTTTPK